MNWIRNLIWKCHRVRRIYVHVDDGTFQGKGYTFYTRDRRYHWTEDQWREWFRDPDLLYLRYDGKMVVDNRKDEA